MSTAFTGRRERAVDYFSPSVRMGLATAVALESGGLLRSAHVDACLAPGWAARALARAAGQRTMNRVVAGIPAARLRRHPQLLVLARARRRMVLSGYDTTLVDRALSRAFRSIARQCDSPAVVGLQSGSLELFAGRQHRIMEQVSPPLRHESAVAAEELARFPGWAPERVARLSGWDHRMEAEWQLADLIWVPSAHLIDISQGFGAPRGKFRVIPYPIPGDQRAPRRRDFRAHGSLRIVFAGTLMLHKGVQYIHQALRARPDLPVTVDFFGPANLTPLGLRRLSEVGTIHGPVPRARLLEEFRRADVLLFPSLSEGSALVTLEAAALGLPVVATPEAGGPACAMTIPARSPDAIIEAIEALAADRALLERLSAAGLAEAAGRTAAAFGARVVESAGELVGASPTMPWPDDR